MHIGQVVQKSIHEALDWVTDAPAHLSKQKNEIAVAILAQVTERLRRPATRQGAAARVVAG